MHIRSDFPGGNISLKEIRTEGDRTVVFLEQDLKGTAHHWFWWYFLVEDAPVGQVDFHFCNGEVVGNYGPAISHDSRHWTWLCPFREENATTHTDFSYTFAPGEKVYFAFSIPYTQREWAEFAEEFAADAAFRPEVLTKSEQGRDIPLLFLGSGAKTILLTARHHACESTGSYALEGFLRRLLTQRRELLEEYTFLVLPFVDFDGVENGDQGKDRFPHDHNRDYLPEPLYHYTRALYALLAQREVEIFLDFHSPWKWGEGDDVPHIHRSSTEKGGNSLTDTFFRDLMEVTAGHRISFRWNPAGLHPGVVKNVEGCPDSKNYFALEKRSAISVTIETPYAGHAPNGYTREEMLDWGGSILDALWETLSEKRKK